MLGAYPFHRTCAAYNSIAIKFRLVDEAGAANRSMVSAGVVTVLVNLHIDELQESHSVKMPIPGKFLIPRLQD
jgi:hypothetical protein